MQRSNVESARRGGRLASGHATLTREMPFTHFLRQSPEEVMKRKVVTACR